MAITISGINPSAQDATMQSNLDPTDSLTSQNIKTIQEKHKEDAIELSSRAKAIMLSYEGTSISEIAVIMNLDIRTVASYIGAVNVTMQAAQTEIHVNHASATSQQPYGSAEVSSGSSTNSRGSCTKK